MKQISLFEAVDGSKFQTEIKCRKYELLINEVKEVMSVLPSRPSKDWSSGDGYIQHDRLQLEEVEREFLKLCMSYSPHEWIQQRIDDPSKIHISYVGRLISESCVKCLCDAYNRFACIGKFSREYGQPYYANNPDQAEDIMLNS